MDEFKSDVHLDEKKSKFLEAFNEQNIHLKSTEVLEKNERIGDKNLTLTPFSNKEKPNSNNFIEKGIKFCKNIINYDNKISNIKVSTRLINKICPNEKDVNLYLNILKNIDWIKDEKPTIKDLTKIVKYFLFIKENKEKTKLYQRSKIQNFFEN